MDEEVLGACFNRAQLCEGLEVSTPRREREAYGRVAGAVIEAQGAVTAAISHSRQGESVSAYSTIVCVSSTGTSLTRFTSAPDVFSVSQNWDWKLSSLRTEEYTKVGGCHLALPWHGLEIRDHKDTEFRPLLEILSSSCGPQLETLELLLQSYKGPCLSCTILPTNYPLLRSLSLRRVAITWTGPVPAGLTNLSLDLTQTNPSDACMPSEGQLLDVIEASPGLETLTIQISEGQLRPIAVRRSPILLSHLKSFALSTRQETWISLLSHLTLSETTYLQRTPSGPVAFIDTIHPVSTLFPTHYQSVLRQATRAKTLRLWATSSCFLFKHYQGVSGLAEAYVREAIERGTNDAQITRPIPGPRRRAYIHVHPHRLSGEYPRFGFSLGAYSYSPRVYRESALRKTDGKTSSDADLYLYDPSEIAAKSPFASADEEQREQHSPFLLNSSQTLGDTSSPYSLTPRTPIENLFSSSPAGYWMAGSSSVSPIFRHSSSGHGSEHGVSTPSSEGKIQSLADYQRSQEMRLKSSQRSLDASSPSSLSSLSSVPSSPSVYGSPSYSAFAVSRSQRPHLPQFSRSRLSSNAASPGSRYPTRSKLRTSTVAPPVDDGREESDHEDVPRPKKRRRTADIGADDSSTEEELVLVPDTQPPSQHPSRTFPLRVPVNPEFPLFYERFHVSSFCVEDSDKYLTCKGLSDATFNPPREPFDLYTPRFVKGKGATKVGISAMTGRPFSPPLAFRTISRTNVGKHEKAVLMQGKCHKLERSIGGNMRPLATKVPL
ncbi:hypothetical protein POSPLADRAFT_1046241 [Postia placenta MAD-698-R-SB12]|uniref:Uncharacterized protein n=1 Tax=Postia placenta MAD-698-R-SB12 TaxID=670580 RepID=A0A1X6N2K4_9APHY|nr:hypothetical protein POSPLADRAFT_1046241 [Postia placenta MAD-698-R-SB12]OSX62849.1 hypothetical protein POSPLADRAFT_1046241 [Postia placenta MAD-698-R-SB12]